MSDELRVYEIYYGDSDFVVAENKQEAIRLLAELLGNDAAEDYDDCGCDAWPDDKPFTIQNAYDNGEPVTKTCAEWAAENGKGFLASTEW